MQGLGAGILKIRNIDWKKHRETFRVKKPWDTVIISALTLLITIPVFLIAHLNLIDPGWPAHLDRVLLFMGIASGIELVLYLLRRIILVFLFLFLLILVYHQVFSDYGFANVAEDYRSMVYTMADNPYPEDVVISKLLPFPSKSKIIKAIDYDNPEVRNFAVAAASKHFRDVKGYNDERKMVQCFAVFKEVRDHWRYVNDPNNREYIARASESVRHFSGDCDDHAVFMAACIMAIGGTPRLISTADHIYPEMLIGTRRNLETANYLIKEELFQKEIGPGKLHYHKDERGQIWLNLDYTAHYPGGPFMSEEILGALTLY